MKIGEELRDNPATYGLILLILAGFVAGRTVSGHVLLLPGTVSYLVFEPWRVFTSLFIHTGFGQVTAIVLAVASILRSVEKEIGSKKAVAVFLGSGVVGNTVHVITADLFSAGEIHVLGASPALLGTVSSTVLIASKVCFGPLKISSRALGYLLAVILALGTVLLFEQHAVVVVAELAAVFTGLASGYLVRKRSNRG